MRFLITKASTFPKNGPTPILKSLVFSPLLIFNSSLGYHNCLPLVQQYKTLTSCKEDLVQICVNKIEEKKERAFLKSGGEKLAIKILMEDCEIDELSSQNNKNDCPPSKCALNIFEPGLCEICFVNNDKIQVGACLHSFCRDCLKQYVENLISIGQVWKYWVFDCFCDFC